MLHGCGRRYLGCGDSSYSDLGQVWSAGCGFGRGVRGLPAQHILGLLARLKDPVPQTDRTFLVRGGLGLSAYSRLEFSNALNWLIAAFMWMG